LIFKFEGKRAEALVITLATFAIGLGAAQEQYRARKQAGGLIGQPLAYARGTVGLPPVADPAISL